MEYSLEDQDMCVGELDLEETIIDNNDAVIPSPTCTLIEDLKNKPSTSSEVGLENVKFQSVHNIDINAETEKSEANKDLQTEVNAFDIIECMKETTELKTSKESECSVVLDTFEHYEAEDLSQEGIEMVQSYASFEYKFQNACHITGAWKEFRKKDNVFMKGCKWSPDGTCILTNSDDNVLRIFDLPRELHCQETWNRDTSLPELEPALRVREGGVIYDYCWYPLMSSWNPLSCCFVSTSKDSPVHLWDAFNGELRCTYRAYNAVDEVEPAHSVAFNPSGEKLYCGFRNAVRVFNTNSPGRECTVRNLKRQFPSKKQTGIISCISVNPALPDVYAAGSYSRSVGLYSEPHGTLLCLLLGHTGGVTHLQFSPDGTKLLSGGRKDSEIICWDIRNPGNILFAAKREVTTNQRIYFDITPNSQYFISGNTNGKVSVWDTSQIGRETTPEPVLSPCYVIQAHNDCVNGISIHHQYPILATTSGQRHVTCSDSESDSDSSQEKCWDTSLKLWWVGNVTASS